MGRRREASSSNGCRAVPLFRIALDARALKYPKFELSSFTFGGGGGQLVGKGGISVKYECNE